LGGHAQLLGQLGGGNAGDSIKDVMKRKDAWERYWKQLEDGKMKLVKPQKNHLYNTFLIESPTCPLAIINHLASKGIYIGNVSACENENINIKNKPKLSGEDGKKYIRISFNKASDLNEKIIDEIIVTMGLAEKAMLED
jgi:cysteine sulfinate desulfinase/cysteine desulfurase-like protein